MHFRRLLPIVVLVFAAVAETAAEDPALAIRGGGGRVADHSARSGDTCSGVAYSPAVLRDESPAIPGRSLVLYTMGGEFIDACANPFMSPARFGDRIWYHYRRPDGAWSNRATDPELSSTPVIDRSSFSWMQDEVYLRTNPEAYVGHAGSPSVVKVNGRYYMIFVATIDDQNLCAGEHSGPSSNCGSCENPWSFFVSMWAVSDDALHWRVYEGAHAGLRRNRAMNASVLWTLPRDSDARFRTPFKGVTRTSMVVREEAGETYFYVGFTLTGSYKVKSGIARFRFDRDSQWGISSDPQVWDPILQTWTICSGGELPPWFNDVLGRGDLLGSAFASLAPIGVVPGFQFVAVSTGNTLRTTANSRFGVGNLIRFSLSNDLIHWTAPTTVESSLEYFADGASYDNSVIDPSFVDLGEGKYSFFIASADGDPSRGVGRDGRHDCAPHFDGSTVPFVGVGIYEGKSVPVSAASKKTPQARRNYGTPGE